jgi:hypothetical protein
MIVVPDDVSRPVGQRGELVVVALGVHEEGPVLRPTVIININRTATSAQGGAHHKKQIHIVQPEIL